MTVPLRERVARAIWGNDMEDAFLSRHMLPLADAAIAEVMAYLNAQPTLEDRVKALEERVHQQGLNMSVLSDRQNGVL